MEYLFKVMLALGNDPFAEALVGAGFIVLFLLLALIFLDREEEGWKEYKKEYKKG